MIVVGAQGRGLIERKGEGRSGTLDEKEYRYLVIEGRDPLGYAEGEHAEALLDGAYHTGRKWLAGTVDSDYPDFVVQMAEYFDAVRAGDLIVFAADGWDFAAENVGGHGSGRAIDMLAPLVLAGPGIRTGGQIGAVRVVDVAPTIIEILDPDQLKKYHFDGRSLLGEIQRK